MVFNRLYLPPDASHPGVEFTDDFCLAWVQIEVAKYFARVDALLPLVSFTLCHPTT